MESQTFQNQIDAVKVHCPLCHNDQLKPKEIVRSTPYLSCDVCGSVCMHTDFYISPEAEKQRYEEHNNDVNNIGYQQFVQPIVQAVLSNFNTNSIGLDYGAGTGPVITKLLREKGYQMALWDPFFHPNTTVLDHQYDFIVCCEVIEHFHFPQKEFKHLKTLLKPDGMLFCKTDLLPESGLQKWYYATDPTHVIFYSPNNLSWIQKRIGFSKLSLDGRLITFQK